MTITRSLILIALQAVLAFIVGMGVIGPLVLADASDPFAPTPQLFALIAVLGGVGAYFLVSLGSVRLPRRSWRELGWHTARLGRHVARGLLGGLAAVALVCAILVVAGATPRELWEVLTAPGLARRAVFLCVGIQAAFIEESLFRGNLLPALEGRTSRPIALVVNGLIFAVYHLSLRPLSIVSKTLFGIIFGALRGRDGSLVAPGVAHVTVWVLAGSM